jgi:hypothetical protein
MGLVPDERWLGQRLYDTFIRCDERPSVACRRVARQPHRDFLAGADSNCAAAVILGENKRLRRLVRTRRATCAEGNRDDHRDPAMNPMTHRVFPALAFWPGVQFSDVPGRADANTLGRL